LGIIEFIYLYLRPERAGKKIFNMSQSLSKLFVHIIFHIKNNSAVIKNEEKNEWYACIGAIIKGMYPRASLETYFHSQLRGILPSAFGGIVQLTNFNALRF